MSDADVLERPFFVVGISLVDLVQCSTGLLPFDHDAEWRMFAIQVVDPVLERDEELRPSDQFIVCIRSFRLAPAPLVVNANKRDCPLLGML